MRRLACFITALLLVVSAIAQKASPGEKMLVEGRKLWQEFCMDMTSHPIGEVLDHLVKAATALKGEGNDEGLCDAAILSAEVFSKNYEYQESAISLCEKILETMPSLSSIYNYRATYLLANLYLQNQAGKASGVINRKHFTIDESTLTVADICLGMCVAARLSQSVDDYDSADYAFSQIKMLDTSSMDRFSLVKYIEAMMGYAQMLMSESKLKEASDFLEGIRALIKKNRLDNSTAIIPFRNAVAQLLLLDGDYRGASNWAQEACRPAMTYISPVSVESIRAAMIYATASSRLGQGEQAVQFLNTVLGFIERQLGVDSPLYYTVMMQLARVYYADKDYVSSAELFQKCVDYAISHRYNEMSAVSEMIIALGAKGEAREILDAGKLALSTLRNYFHENFLFLSDASRQRSWNATGLTLVNSIANAVCPDVDTEGILYTLSLLSKGALLDTSTQVAEIYEKNGDTDFLFALRAYRETLQQLEDEFARPEPNQAVISKMRDRLFALSSLVSNHYAEIPKEELTWCEATWEDISNHLAVDEAAVEYFRFSSIDGKENNYIASVLVKGKPPVNITLAVDEQALSALSPSSLCQKGFLHDIFLRPISGAISGKKRVYYSPVGVMNGLPLECMEEDYNVMRLTSTRRLLIPNDEQRWSSAAFFGGLDYNLAPEEMEYYAESTSRGRFPSSSRFWSPLQGSLSEVTEAYSITDVPDKVLVTGGEGVEERFKALSGRGVNLIHVATHGYFDISAGEERGVKLSEEDLAMYHSGLVFAGVNNHLPSSDGIDNGLLSSLEVARMNLLGCRLVILSACGSGRTVSGRTSDLYGLLRAFKKAGCQSVLMTLWDVDDEVTALLMSFFYKALSRGESPSSALAYAREETRKSYPDPSYWAPFILID